ncbi:MAG: hypothetical protein RR229_08200 [Oscillospiraceae bacterium]
MLQRLGIVKSKNKGYYTFMQNIAPDFLNNTMLPSEYVRDCWEKYENCPVAKNNALNGSVFEIIIATLFTKEGITPIHLQAKIAFVPNVNFDLVLYANETGPIGISLKTSLRERYKQADLEAIALKYVHRKAENYLLSLDKAETQSVNQKITNGDVMGINKAILTTDSEFDEFVNMLKQKELITPEKVEIISATRIVTEEKVNTERANSGI